MVCGCNDVELYIRGEDREGKRGKGGGRPFRSPSTSPRLRDVVSTVEEDESEGLANHAELTSQSTNIYHQVEVELFCV